MQHDLELAELTRLAYRMAQDCQRLEDKLAWWKYVEVFSWLLGGGHILGLLCGAWLVSPNWQPGAVEIAGGGLLGLLLCWSLCVSRAEATRLTVRLVGSRLAQAHLLGQIRCSPTGERLNWAAMREALLTGQPLGRDERSANPSLERRTNRT